MASSAESSMEPSPDSSATPSTASTDSSTMSTVQGVEKPPDETSKLRMFLGILRKYVYFKTAVLIRELLFYCQIRIDYIGGQCTFYSTASLCTNRLIICHFAGSSV
jgi:hypothetical protein